MQKFPVSMVKESAGCFNHYRRKKERNQRTEFEFRSCSVGTHLVLMFLSLNKLSVSLDLFRHGKIVPKHSQKNKEKRRKKQKSNGQQQKNSNLLSYLRRGLTSQFITVPPTKDRRVTRSSLTCTGTC